MEGGRSEKGKDPSPKCDEVFGTLDYSLGVDKVGREQVVREVRVITAGRGGGSGVR